MLVAIGLNRRQLFLFWRFLLLIVGSIGWNFVLKPYQKVRVVSFESGAIRMAAATILFDKNSHWSGTLVWKRGWEGPQTSNGFCPNRITILCLLPQPINSASLVSGAILAAGCF